MTDNNHPITPPPKLVQAVQAFLRSNPSTPAEMTYEQFIATRFARWGADMELEACCEWIRNSLSEDPQEVAQELRAARRPKPPSLKEQALEQLKSLEVAFLASHGGNAKTESIRRALESLPD